MTFVLFFDIDVVLTITINLFVETLYLSIMYTFPG